MSFAFIIHSRDYKDVQRKFKMAKYLPRKLVEFWCMRWPPVIVSKITGLRTSVGGKNVAGWLIGVPMTAKQILQHRVLAKKRIIQAIKKAEKLGAEVIGLGALTASVTNGGLDIVEKLKSRITNGNTLTAAVSLEDISKILIQNHQIKKIAVVGGTGSIGQAIVKLLASNFPRKEYLIFARTQDNLDKLINYVRSKNPSIKIVGYANNLRKLCNADFVVVTTSATGAIIEEKNLKSSAIVYDITQPKNINSSILRNKPNVKIIDGGLVCVPGIKGRLPFGLPKKTVFACFAETAILAMEEDEFLNKKDTFVGKVDINIIKKIWELFLKHNFYSSSQINKK